MTVSVVRLRTDDDSGLIAVSNPAPRLSWSLASEERDVVQQAYEVQVAAAPDFADAATSGEVESDVVVDHDWPAAPLAGREVRFWRVRVRTARGWTDWSAPARVEAALLQAGDWTARPVYVVSDRDRSGQGPVPLVRYEFDLPAEPVSARLYVTALGAHRTLINGVEAGDEILAPGWTSYPDRLLYASYDVVSALHAGANEIRAAVGDGWYRGNLGWSGHRNHYGQVSALLAQLEITFADGRRQTIVTDENWRGGYGDLRRADIYDGCERDLRISPTYDQPVGVLDLPAGLAQRAHPPVRVLQTIPPQLGSVHGVTTVDAGQNLTGWLRVRVTGPAGGTVTVRHAEVLDPGGRLHTALLRSARATDTYVLAGGSAELEPEFTFHGFRYAEIEASDGVDVEAVEVVVVASDLRRTGTFQCDDERVNQLYSNVIWSQRDNFLAIPTDCPQRDERLGWTGDIMAFSTTAATNFDSRAFLDSWLTDVDIEQMPSGGVPMVVPFCLPPFGAPDVPLKFADGAAGWADVVTVLPAALHEAYGYRGLLGRHYRTMRRWVDYVETLLDEDGTWSGYMHFGDWLDPAAPAGKPFLASTNTDYVASCFAAHSARLVAVAARELGEDGSRYDALADRIADATWKKWHEHARTTQTGCTLAIEFGVAPEQERTGLGDALAALVRANGGKVGTGFLGTPFVLFALTRTGHADEAYRLLLNEDCPGWLYQVKLGATTTWERWDAIRPDGTINDSDMADGSSMTSFNHYAYGSVAAWLYRSVAGLAPARPGYREIVVAPHPGPLKQVSASVDTEYGAASITWSDLGSTLEVDLVLPPGTTGQFHVPSGWSLDRPGAALGSGRHFLVLQREHNA